MYLPNILPYTVKVYQCLYEDEFITSFTQSHLAKGETDLVKASKFVDRLNAGSSRAMPCISFNQARLKGNQISGGSCSAIAFRVAKEALSVLKSLKENKELTPSSRERSFASQLSRFVQIQEQIATGEAAEKKREQLEFRTEQMALNTITVDRKQSGNAVAEKVSAMAPFYGLKVVESSSELGVRGNDQLEAQLSKQTRSLKEGVYFLRIITEENNYKREQQGHSIVYIKTGDAEYYFDSQLGFYHLFPEVTKTNLIYNALLSANQTYKVDVLSFHRLEEENPISADCDSNLGGILYTPRHPLEACPVVIFSPALGQSICAYKNMAQGLCSKGFIVMCLDHPGTGIGTPMLEEQEIIARGLQNASHIAKLAERIRSGEFANIPRDAPIGVLGHSLGGSASVEACRRTAEIGAAINLDGRIIEPTDISQPVLQLVAKRVKEDRSKYNEALETLAQTNPLLTRKEVEAKHEDFCSSYPGFLNFTIDECEDFFKKHLLNGARK